MPVVDLSNIGLEGQQAFATRMATLAQSKQMEASAREQELQNQETEKMNELNAMASAKLASLARGDRSVGGIDVEDSASRMDSLASPLEVTAEIFAKNGAPGKAMEMYKSASEIRKRESDIEKDALTAEQTRLENIIKGGDLVSRTIGIARNQSEWDYGIEQLRKQRILDPEQLDAISQMPFNPDVAAYFNEQAISAADRAKNALTQAGQDRQERQSAATRAQEERKIRLQAQRDADQERHRVWERKTGGKNAPSASTPTDREVQSAKRLLKTEVFRDVGDDDDDLSAASEYIASQAKSILQNNKAITWDTAVQQAMLRGQQDGALSLDPGKTRSWFDPRNNVPAKAKFKVPVGKTKEAPAPLPKSAKEMKKGQYYVTSKGVVQWDGSKGIPVTD